MPFHAIVGWRNTQIYRAPGPGPESTVGENINPIESCRAELTAEALRVGVVGILQEVPYTGVISSDQTGRKTSTEDGPACLLHEALQLPGRAVKCVEIAAADEGGDFFAAVSINVIYDQPHDFREDPRLTERQGFVPEG